MTTTRHVAPPCGWRMVPLKYLASVAGGMTPSKDRADFWDGEVPWISPKDMKRPILHDSEDHVTQLALDTTGLKVQPAGSVLIVTRGMILAHTFPVARNSVPAAINQDMKALRAKAGIGERYLAWMLQGLQSQMLSLTEESAHGTKALRTDQWANEAVPIPSTSDQERIANFLDEKTKRIDALIAEKQRLAAATKEYELSESSRVLTVGLNGMPLRTSGSPFVPRLPSDWTLMYLKRALSGIEQGWSPQCEERPAEGDEWGVLKVGCVNGSTFNPTENKALPSTLAPDLSCVLHRGDVLISRANTRELVGLAALVEHDCPTLLLCDKLFRLLLKPTILLPEFAVIVLRAQAAREQIELAATGASSSMLNISKRDVAEIHVGLPSLAEQRKIAKYVFILRSRAHYLLNHIAAHVERLREYRSSLISAAVTGTLRADAFEEAA